MKQVATIIIFLNLFVFKCNAQSFEQDLNQFSKLNSAAIETKKYDAANNNTNEIQIILSGLFLFYKKTISSQDASSCAFHTSCSEYALLAVKKQGVVLGGINFFDRFTRCNTCSPYQYTINPITHRFEDFID